MARLVRLLAATLLFGSVTGAQTLRDRDTSVDAYAQLVRAYRTARAQDAVARFASWPPRAALNGSMAAVATLSASERMTAAILHVETANVLLDVQPFQAINRIQTGIDLVRAAGHDPFGSQIGEQPRRTWFYVAASVLTSAGYVKAAREVITRGLMFFPGDGLLYFARALADEHDVGVPPGDLDHRGGGGLSLFVVKDLIRAIDADPHLAIAQLHLGGIRLRARDVRAREPLEIALREANDDGVRYLAHLFLGRMHEQAERWSDAEREYAAAFQTGAGYQSACVAYSNIEDQLGHVDRARDLAAQCFALVGHFDPWWDLRIQFDRDALLRLRAEAHLP
jgi:hypothetical protein